MNRIIQVIMARDGISQKEADALLIEAQERVFDGEDPAEVLEDVFGLEPDYIDDLV